MEPKLQRWVQRQGWDRASSCYEQYWRKQLKPATDLVLRTADLRPGEHVIDVACGTGLVTFPAAAAVAPTGRVFATDISSKMVADLERRTAAGRLANVEVACRDAENLDVEQASPLQHLHPRRSQDEPPARHVRRMGPGDRP